MDDRQRSHALPGRRWAAAIRARRSRRSYDGRRVDPAVLDALAQQCARFRPFPHARAALIREAPADLWSRRRDDRRTMGAVGSAFIGILGSYGRIDGAPSALAFVGVPPDGAERAGISVEAQVGYTGEAAVLEATALGLDTCWVGGFFSPGTSEALIGAGGDELVLAVSPVGYAQGHLSGRERHFFRMGRPKKRLEPQEIVADATTDHWPGWALAGLEAVRPAPSAMNRQPWRFRLDDGAVVIAADAPDGSGISRRIDCGIAMLHFELGARASGCDGSWAPPDGGRPLDVARWRVSGASTPA